MHKTTIKANRSRRFRSSRWLSTLLVLALCTLVSGAWAQLGLLDEQASAPVGGGGAGARGVQRARAAAGEDDLRDFDDGAREGPIDGPGRPGQFRRDAVPVDPMAGLPRFTVRRIPAVEGQRIYDAVSYRLQAANALVLDDPRRIEITEDRIHEFSDDGRTLGDMVANDGLYSRILPESTEQYIGGDSQYSLTRMIAVLKVAQELSPLDFFNVNVLTTERFSSVPKMRAKVMEKNDKVHLLDERGNFSGWSDVFLKDYRVDRENPESKFFDLYVPAPPSPPAIKSPVAPWLPFTHPEMRVSEEEMRARQQEARGGGPAGRGGGGGGGGGDYFDDRSDMFF